VTVQFISVYVLWTSLKKSIRGGVTRKRFVGLCRSHGWPSRQMMGAVTPRQSPSASHGLATAAAVAYVTSSLASLLLIYRSRRAVPLSYSSPLTNSLNFISSAGMRAATGRISPVRNSAVCKQAYILTEVIMFLLEMCYLTCACILR